MEEATLPQWHKEAAQQLASLNGDGRSDLVLGAPGAGGVGMVYVIFGQTNGWSASFNLTTLDGSNGFCVEGLNTDDELGSSVSTAGDMNGDGLSDLVLGAYSASPAGRKNAGAAYVIFGQANDWPASFDLMTLNGSNGFWVKGLVDEDHLGFSVSTAGDINDDRLSDWVLGTRGVFPSGRSNGKGTAYVIFGQVGDWPVSFNLTTLDGSNGFRVEGVDAWNELGSSVSTAGDINGDGKDSLLIGAPGFSNNTGIAYVIFLKPPQVIHPLPNQTAERDQPFSFQMVSDTFKDPGGDALIYSAKQINSNRLPNWLTFNDTSLVFSGTPNQTGMPLYHII